MKRIVSRLVAGLLIATMSSVALAAPAEREVRAAKLVAHGVAPAEAEARVAALTEEEAAEVAPRIDSLPAGGGNGAGLFVIIMVVGVTLVVIVKLLPIVIAGTLVTLAAKDASKRAHR